MTPESSENRKKLPKLSHQIGFLHEMLSLYGTLLLQLSLFIPTRLYFDDSYLLLLPNVLSFVHRTYSSQQKIQHILPSQYYLLPRYLFIALFIMFSPPMPLFRSTSCTMETGSLEARRGKEKSVVTSWTAASYMFV